MLAPRQWKCFSCAKLVEPARNAAGQWVCPQCTSVVTPVLEHQSAGPALPQPQPKPKSGATSPMAKTRSSVAASRPATPGEALAASGAWVPDPEPASSSI